MDEGAFDDWNTCDWFCVKVLHRLMEDGEPNAHSELLSWSHSATLWTKRASLVGFVNLLPKREMDVGFDDGFVAAAGRVAEDQRRFCQTSIGWTMRELSVRRPSLVEDFLENHLVMLSREAITNASKKLDARVRQRLLEAHRSA
jgi:3-methyladenine DNA glycosylase AlkD